MKIIIVDTNIIFSAILNPKNPIGDLLFNHGEQLEFYTSEYLREEIDQHRNKILSLSKTSIEQVNEVIYQIYKQISFISDQQIPYQHWAISAPLVRILIWMTCPLWHLRPIWMVIFGRAI